jgi:hypothetical protein
MRSDGSAPPGNRAPVLRSGVHRADRAGLRRRHGRAVARRAAGRPVRRRRGGRRGRPDHTDAPVGSPCLEPRQFTRIRRDETEFGQQFRRRWKRKRKRRRLRFRLRLRLRLPVERPVWGRQHHRAQHLCPERAELRLPGAKRSPGSGSGSSSSSCSCARSRACSDSRSGACSRPCADHGRRRRRPLYKWTRERRQQEQVQVAPH